MATTSSGSSSRLTVLQGMALRPDGKRVKIHPAASSGRFTQLQGWLYPVLIAIYAALPWIKVKGEPLVFVDFEHRRFFLFGLTFNSTDFYLAFFALSGVGFMLIVLSALYGRVWCGYACPQTVFLEGIYRRIETLVEGRASERIKRDRGDWTGSRFARAFIKHVLFILVSLAVAHLFLSYFATVAQVEQMVRRPPSENWGAFLVMAAVAGFFYFNFAWFREQMCVVICPYGRLQSVLADTDTVVVGYDALRGEPRGKKGTVTGDCVDCLRCVQVCPTGIDIRNGLQLECIGCAHCVDACDEVMGKIGRAPGLIRYDSGTGLQHQPKRFWRPRVFGYLAAFAAGAVAFTLGLSIRRPFDVAVLRVQAAPYTRTADAVVNNFVLHLTSKSNATSHMKLEVAAPEGAKVILPFQELDLAPFESRQLPLMVEIDQPQQHHAKPITVKVVDASTGHAETASSTLLGL